MSGPTTTFSKSLHARKYRGAGESFREAMNRIAGTLKDNDAHWKALRDILLDMRFLPAGRIQAAIGSTNYTTAFNCFVSGSLYDSFVDGHGSIMQRATEAAATMRMGGGIGYDFSPLRPRNSLIKKLQSNSSGPVSFMDIFNAICLCISSTDHRRGAQMGVLRVDHPDIEEFVRSKQNSHRFKGFNISVAITNEFMEAVKAKAPFDLQWEGKHFKTISAYNLWESIMRSTWDWADPGVLFIDTINQANNLWYCETLSATNPCAEQPLPPYGSCLLGSVNLVKYLYKTVNGYQIDGNQIVEDIPHIIRAMDNVIDSTNYPLFEQEREAKSKRRMGIGITGLANALEACGYPYGSPDFLVQQVSIQKLLVEAIYRESVRLAEEKGAFADFNKHQYGHQGFVSKLTPDLLSAIKDVGIRNSHLTSIAPTGTISLTADNISSGIEPVFAYEQDRVINTGDGELKVKIQDYGASIGVHGKTINGVTVDEHLAVLIEAQRHVDSSVSKTINVPASTPWEDFKEIYLRAWEGGCKGCTTYKVGGNREAIIEEAKEEMEEELACRYDPETGVRSCDD